MNFFNDGILEAILYPNNWVFCRWIQNTHGHLQKKLIEDLNLVEKKIYEEKLCGWFTWSELQHEQFHKLLTKFGAIPREVKGNLQYFIKPISGVGDLHKKAVV